MSMSLNPSKAKIGENRFRCYPVYPAICRAVRPPPQNSAGAKKLDGSRAAIKIHGSRIISGGRTNTPTDLSFTLSPYEDKQGFWNMM